MCQLHFSLWNRRSPEHVEYEKNSQWRKRRRARWVFTERPLYARHSQGAHYSRFWNSRPQFSWNNVVTILYIFYLFTYSLLQFSLSLFNTGRPLFSFQPSLVLHLLFVTRSGVERQLFKSSAFLVSTLEVRFPYPLADGSDVHLQVIWENLTRTLVESRPKGLFT